MVEKVTDVKAMAIAGIMSTPGVAIDGNVVHAGGLRDAARVERWQKGQGFAVASLRDVG